MKIPNADQAIIDEQKIVVEEAAQMDLPLYEDTILLVDIADEGLVAGDIGTVVERHDTPGVETGYSVEFFDLLGNTVAIITVPARSLRRPAPGDRPVVRPAEPAMSGG